MGPDAAINSADDAYRSPRQVRLESAKLTFEKGYSTLNKNFIVLIVVETVRFLIYAFQRLSSWKSFVNWKTIPPGFFYLIFATEVVINVQLLRLVWQST
jgi:hypothetical protein